MTTHTTRRVVQTLLIVLLVVDIFRASASAVSAQDWGSAASIPQEGRGVVDEGSGDDNDISLDEAIGVSLDLTPPSHFSNLEECRTFIENDPVMKPLCSCGCCEDKNGRYDGCYCPKCDKRKSSLAELMVSPNFRTPEKQFEPLLCPMQLAINSLDSGCSFREWDIERMVNMRDKNEPQTRLGRVLAPI